MKITLKRISAKALSLLLIASLIQLPFPEVASAAVTKLRQEINITNKYLFSPSGSYATSSERVNLDSSKYSGATYYFEVVASTTALTNATVYLKNATSSAIVASTTINGTAYARYRSSAFTAPSMAMDLVVVLGNEAVGKGVIASRIVILQSGDGLDNTQTQIEIGNYETGKSNTTTGALSGPKYWYYDSSKWDATALFYPEVTYKNIQVASSTTYNVSATTTTTYASYIGSPGVSYVTIEAWGAGGGGGNGATGGGGGGGGAYARSTTTVVAGSVNVLGIGGGGARASAATAASSTYTGATGAIVRAAGGTGTAGAAGGAGGTVAASVGDVRFAGGTGGAGHTTGDVGGGGGGAAGPDGAGVNASNAGASAPTAGGRGDNNLGGLGGAAGTTNTDVCSTTDGKPGQNDDRGAGGGGGAGGDGTGVCTGGNGGSPGGGGGGSDGGVTNQLGGPGRIILKETLGQVNIGLEEDDGSFGNWTIKQMIVVNGVSTSTPTRARGSSFVPTSGRNYRLVASTTHASATYDIYSAKIVVTQERVTSVEGNGFSIASVNDPALAGLSSTTVAFIDGTNESLRTYSFNGTDWSLIGNGFSIAGAGIPALAALSSSRVAFIDSINEALTAYEFDGTNWSQVGNGLTIGTTNSPALAALTSTRVAFIDSGNDTLAAYEFNGSSWSQVGNSLAISGVGDPTLAALSATRVAFIDSINESMRTYEFDGTNWSQVGNSLTISGTGDSTFSAISASRVAFIDSVNQSLRTYEFDGTNWSLLGTNLSIGVVNAPALATLSSSRVALIDAGNDSLKAFNFGSRLTKLEPQYLLASSGDFGSSTGLKNLDTFYDPDNWSNATLAYFHEVNGTALGTADAKLQSDPNATPVDVSGSDITDAVERERSTALTMPASAATLDVNVTGTGALTASRIIVQVDIILGGPILDQLHYRWRDSNASESTSAYAAGQDTPLISGVYVGDRNHLRFLVANNGESTATNITYRLEHSSSTCSAWSAVPTVPTLTNEHWVIDLSANVNNADATLNLGGLSDPDGKNFIPGYVMTSSNQTPGHSLTPTQFTELEFSIKSTANVVSDVTYCFRLTHAGSDANFLYTRQPQVIVGRTSKKPIGGGGGGGGENSSGGGSPQGGGGKGGGKNTEEEGGGYPYPTPIGGGGGAGGGGGDSE